MGPPLPEGPPSFPAPRDGAPAAGSSSWRRIMLMILAITIHNIPGEPRGSIPAPGQPHPGRIARIPLPSPPRRWHSLSGRLWKGSWSRSWGAEPREALAAEPPWGGGSGEPGAAAAWLVPARRGWEL